MQSDNNIEKPSEDNGADKNGVDDLSLAHWLPRGLFAAIGPIALLVVIVGGGIAYYAYYHVTKDSVRFPFWVSFMFSFLAFVVLLVQSVIYAQQAEFMKQQSRSMQQSVERTDTIIENMQGQLISMVNQERAMQGQLEVMNRQAEATQEQVIRTLRAYVSATRGEGSGNYFRVTIENTGNTPARNVSVRHVLGQGFNAPHLSEAMADDFTYIGLLAPGRDFSLEVRGQELTAEVHAIMDSNPKFHVWCVGDITYLDSFGELRETEFCFYRTGGSNTLHPWPLRGYDLHEEAETAD